MRDHLGAACAAWYVPFEAASWCIGLLLLPLALLWRSLKLIHQMACDE